MKNTPVDPYAAADIRAQVDKILRGLGNPPPPLRLEDVRELLKLDRRFYSTTDTTALQETISRITIGAKQIFKRSGLLIDVVRKAELKALWIPDRRRILIDESVPDPKKRHVEAHEIIHGVTPHHAPYVFGDDGFTLEHSCYEKLEREANYGSGQLLFLREKFSDEAMDLAHTLKTVHGLHKKFGNTITMTLWRLVEEAHRGEPIFGVVSAHPRHRGDGFDPKNPCRYLIESPRFRERFGNVTELEAFKGISTYATWSKRGPLGEGDVHFTDKNGDVHRFHLETFFNGYEALTLGVYVCPVNVLVACR